MELRPLGHGQQLKSHMCLAIKRKRNYNSQFGPTARVGLWAKHFCRSEERAASGLIYYGLKISNHHTYYHSARFASWTIESGQDLAHLPARPCDAIVTGVQSSAIAANLAVFAQTARWANVCSTRCGTVLRAIMRVSLVSCFVKHVTWQDDVSTPSIHGSQR